MRDVCQILKKQSTKKREAIQIFQYKQKLMQSDLYINLDKGGHEQPRCNTDPKKVGAIINCQKQMIETNKGKQNSSMDIESDKYWLWEKCAGGVMHSSTTML